MQKKYSSVALKTVLDSKIFLLKKLEETNFFFFFLLLQISNICVDLNILTTLSSISKNFKKRQN